MTLGQDTPAQGQNSIAVRSTAESFLQSRLTACLFAFCLVGLTFKQLQFFGSAGPVEILTAGLCIVILAAAVAAGRSWTSAPILIATVMAACVVISTAIAYVVEPTRLSLREVAAYAFCYVIFVSFIQLSKTKGRLVAQATAVVIGIYLGLTAIWWVLPSPLNAIVSYPVNGKFQGLSNNPNQIAFLALVGLSLLYLLDDGHHRAKRTLVLSIAMGAAGAFSGSSAFALGLFAALFIASVWSFFSMLAGGENGKFPWLFVVPLVLSIGAIVFVRPESPSPTAPPPTVSAPAQNESSQISTLLEADGGEGSIRLEMWSTALERFASSPVFGLGPGTHVPWPHPISGDISYNEAHNNILDILLVVGAIGLAAALVPVGIVVVKSAQANRLPEAAIAIAPIAVFAMVHYIGRQPLTWIFFATTVLILSRHQLLKRSQ